MELPKTSKQACPGMHCKLRIHKKKKMFVSCFFKAPSKGDISRNCCYLYIYSLLFQSMINRFKSLVKGGVDSVLLSLSTSPHPTPPFKRSSLTTWLKSAPEPRPALDVASEPSRGEGWNLLVDIVPLFHFSIMSLVADVHMCCPCVYPERRTLFLVLLPFIFLL